MPMMTQNSYLKLVKFNLKKNVFLSQSYFFKAVTRRLLFECYYTCLFLLSVVRDTFEIVLVQW